MNAEQVKIRPATPDDVPLLAEIEVAAAKMFPAGRLPDPDATLSSYELLAGIEARLLLVAECDGTLAGFALAQIHDDEMHLEEMDVAPAFGRRGLGRALLKEIIRDARRRHLVSITLTSFDDIPWNALFYESMGFQKCPPERLSPRLNAILEREEKLGLSNRVAMTLPL